jgi:hypothetical protein
MNLSGPCHRLFRRTTKSTQLGRQLRRMPLPRRNESVPGRRQCLSLKFRPLDAARPRISLQDGFSHAFRPFCCHGNAGILRLGGPKPVVHSGLRRRVRPRVRVWLPAGRLAFRRGRGHLGRHSSMALANEDEQCLEAPKGRIGPTLGRRGGRDHASRAISGRGRAYSTFRADRFSHQW